MVEGKEVERINYLPLAIDFYLFELLIVGQSLQKTGALSMNFVIDVDYNFYLTISLCSCLYSVSSLELYNMSVP